MPYRRVTNPYEFIQMEKWCSSEGEIQAVVGYTRDGHIYFTGNVKEEVPVFSHSCKIGENLTLEQFKAIQSHCLQKVVALTKLTYKINGLKEEYQFNTTPVEPNQRFNFPIQWAFKLFF